MLSVINDIAGADRAVGWMALQIDECAKDQRWYVALASLFMLSEQVLRWSTDATSGETLSGLIKKAREDDLITAEEEMTLNNMRKYRNKYMHSNFHGEAFVFDGTVCGINEEETAGKVYATLSTPCFSVILRLIKGPL